MAYVTGIIMHTAQDTTQLAWYGGHWRPLHEAMTYRKSIPFVFGQAQHQD